MAVINPDCLDEQSSSLRSKNSSLRAKRGNLMAQSVHHYLHWSGVQEIAALALATTSLKNVYF
ncbi:MAG: hypothetical protein ACI92E_000226 [Oceanicoccus sp.]